MKILWEEEGFRLGFKGWKGWAACKVLWEWKPNMGSKAREGDMSFPPTAHCGSGVCCRKHSYQTTESEISVYSEILKSLTKKTAIYNTQTHFSTFLFTETTAIDSPQTHFCTFLFTKKTDTDSTQFCTFFFTKKTATDRTQTQFCTFLFSRMIPDTPQLMKFCLLMDKSEVCKYKCCPKGFYLPILHVKNGNFSAVFPAQNRYPYIHRFHMKKSQEGYCYTDGKSNINNARY